MNLHFIAAYFHTAPTVRLRAANATAENRNRSFNEQVGWTQAYGDLTSRQGECKAPWDVV